MLKSYGIGTRGQVIIYQSIEEKAKPTPPTHYHGKLYRANAESSQCYVLR